MTWNGVVTLYGRYLAFFSQKVSEPTTLNWLKLDPYCLRQIYENKCLYFGAQNSLILTKIRQKLFGSWALPGPAGGANSALPSPNCVWGGEVVGKEKNRKEEKKGERGRK